MSRVAGSEVCAAPLESGSGVFESLSRIGRPWRLSWVVGALAVLAALCNSAQLFGRRVRGGSRHGCTLTAPGQLRGNSAMWQNGLAI